MPKIAVNVTHLAPEVLEDDLATVLGECDRRVHPVVDGAA